MSEDCMTLLLKGFRCRQFQTCENNAESVSDDDKIKTQGRKTNNNLHVNPSVFLPVSFLHLRWKCARQGSCYMQQWSPVTLCRCHVTVQISSLSLYIGEHAQTEAAAPCQTHSMMCPRAPAKLHNPGSHSQMVHCEQATRKHVLYIDVVVIRPTGPVPSYPSS